MICEARQPTSRPTGDPPMLALQRVRLKVSVYGMNFPNKQGRDRSSPAPHLILRTFADDARRKLTEASKALTAEQVGKRVPKPREWNATLRPPRCPDGIDPGASWTAGRPGMVVQTPAHPRQFSLERESSRAIRSHC